MTDKITITFDCKKCGGTILELPDNYTDASLARCKNCGVEYGTWSQIKAKAMDAAKAQVTTDFRNVFKNMKGWKVR